MYRKSEPFLFLFDKLNQGYAWKYNTKSHGVTATKYVINKVNVMGFKGEERLNTGKATFNINGFFEFKEIKNSE
jgi:hypothetical protein